MFDKDKFVEDYSRKFKIGEEQERTIEYFLPKGSIVIINQKDDDKLSCEDLKKQIRNNAICYYNGKEKTVIERENSYIGSTSFKMNIYFSSDSDLTRRTVYYSIYCNNEKDSKLIIKDVYSDGSMYHTLYTSFNKDSANQLRKILVTVNYYNPQTASMISVEEMNPESLKELFIYPDDMLIDTMSFSNIIELLDNHDSLKNKLLGQSIRLI